MKTKKTVSQFSIIIMMIFGLVSFQSCETEIPPEDPTPPEFILQISGDGFFHEFNQDSDFDNFQLNLRSGARYNFIFSASDQGGVDLIQFYTPGSDTITFENPILAPWTFRNIGVLQSVFQWVGERDNPLTGGVISDHFRVRGNNLAVPFRIYVKDFGGEGRRPNEISEELNVFIGNHSTEIRNF